MKNFLFEIQQLFSAQEPFVLATILERAGSAPRTIGARMAVRGDGSIVGTIGGGLFEAQVIQAAEQTFDTCQDSLQDYHFNAREASDLGMICGGSTEVLLEYFEGGDERGEVFDFLVEALKQRLTAWLVTAIRTSGQNKPQVFQCGLSQDGQLVGSSLVNPQDLLEIAKGVQGLEPQWRTMGEQRLLIEPVHAQGAVYIFGAGHVSQMLAPLTSWVGFYTVVLDDRVEFANRERFATADEVIVVDSFQGCMAELAVDEESYLVIITRGHLDDQVVLEQAMQTPAKYIGMIGSKRKRELIYRSMLDAGFTQEDLHRVHSPIGLPIEAETPEEIAVSILAELIRERAS